LHAMTFKGTQRECVCLYSSLWCVCFVLFVIYAPGSFGGQHAVNITMWNEPL